jgi:threonine dehydrogenase-like Zn-dependent dehydrogenase
LDKLDKYLVISEKNQIPETMQAIVLEGVGEKYLKLKNVKVPECSDNQILGRVDAVNACASDNKLIEQGGEHPLMHGWEVSKYPIIIGHEGVITVVKVGNKLKEQYSLGQKFAIQPAIPCGPLSHIERYKKKARRIDKIAVGYTLPGLFAEYVLIPEEVIMTGCLLPFPNENISYFGGALAEPISDVISAHENIVHVLKDSPTSNRRVEIGVKKEGFTLIIGAGPMGLMHLEIALNSQPSKIIVSELLSHRKKRAEKLFQEKAKNLGISIIFTDPERLESVIKMETDNRGVDDAIIALGIAKVQEESLKYLARGGVATFFGGTPYKDRIIKIDTHRIHYDGVKAVGSSGSDPSDVARALEMIALGKVDPGNYVVRCGGLDAAISLIKSVRRKEIDGKGVIYPHTRSTIFNIEDWNLKKELDFLEDKLNTI